MSLALYNTKKRKKQEFKPLKPNEVSMYVCGPTVYNYIHIGNARPVVVFDTLFRVLQTLYEQVTYVRNITDIDDKIMNKAKEEGVAIDVIADRYTQAYSEDTRGLNTLAPTHCPRATHYVPGMIDIIQTLMDKDHAYAANGDVLFDVESMPTYGSLSNQNQEDLRAGASERVGDADYKKHPSDFVLWKPSAKDEPGWDSPWGRGRPGWHTECVVMIHEILGPNIDIHGGGRDLIFPHHENELAQSLCAHNHAADFTEADHYVQCWMHNGFLNMDGEKMSKSLGNVSLVRDLLKEYKGEVIRFALLSAHYRSEQDFNADLLTQSKASLDSLYTALRDAADVKTDAAISVSDSPAYKALLDDINTPIAISHLHQLAKDLNKSTNDTERSKLKSLLLKSGELMGLLQEAPSEWLKTTASAGSINESSIETLIQEREEAKLNKQYQRADEIRDQLKEENVILEDSREGTSWRRV